MTNEHDKLIERLNGAKQRYFDDVRKDGCYHSLIEIECAACQAWSKRRVVDKNGIVTDRERATEDDVVESCLQDIIKNLGEPDIFSHWQLDEGNLRHILHKLIAAMQKAE